MTLNMLIRNRLFCLLATAFLVLTTTWPPVQGFNVGVKSTKCNLDPSKGDINDPCQSLYDGICGGNHCACPAGTHEDSGLKRCVPGEAPKKSSSGTQAAGGSAGFDPLDDLPFDYEPPGKKTTPKPSAPALPVPAQPPPQRPPAQPQPGYPGQPGYPPPPQPGYPGQPQPGYPGQPGQYPPGQPGQYPPGQPGLYPPGQYPGQYPPQPGQPGYPGKAGPSPTQKPTYRGGSSDNVGEKAGGGVGGVVGLLIIGGLIYFCCCRGAKGKEMMSKFSGGRFQGIPFIGGQRAGQGMQMQQSAPVQQDPNFAGQHTYIPPGGGDPNAAQYPPGQQPYPPPAGFIPDGQQPPPYTQQYQPNAPPPQ